MKQITEKQVWEVVSSAPWDAAKYLGHLLTTAQVAEIVRREPKKNRGEQCPKCGTVYKDWQRSGLCPECSRAKHTSTR